MKFDIEFILRPGYLLVRSSGDFELSRAMSGIADMLEVARDHSISKILFDNRQLTRGLYATEKTLFGVALETAYREHLDKKGIPVRVATMTPPQRLSVFQPFVETLRGAGIDTQTFDDGDELAAWLGIELTEDSLSR